MTTYKWGCSPAFKLLVSQASLTEYEQARGLIESCGMWEAFPKSICEIKVIPVAGRLCYHLTVLPSASGIASVSMCFIDFCPKATMKGTHVTQCKIGRFLRHFTAPHNALSHSRVADVFDVRRPEVLTGNALSAQLREWHPSPALYFPSYDSNIAFLVVNQSPRGGGKCI